MGRRPRSPRRLGHAAVALLLGTSLAACAARPPRSMSDRFVRPPSGDAETVELLDLLPRVDDGAPAPAADVPPAWPAGTDRRPRPKHSNGTTIEQLDERLAAALAVHGGRPSVDTAIAVAAEYGRLGILDDAFDVLSAALTQAPEDGGLLAARARVWRDWGLPQIGLGDATRAVYFAPGSPGAQNTLGTLLMALGQIDAARRRFDLARGLAPDAAYVRSNLCYLELTAGNADAALAHCDAALALDPTLDIARENRALIRRQAPQRLVPSTQYLAPSP